MSSKKELFNILEKIGDSLDVTPTQHEKAKDRYHAIGKWLAEGEYCMVHKKLCLKNGEIYPQGSIKLETTVKPLGQEEFDIDLVFYTPDITTDDISPEELKELIGDRLKEHEKYRKMLKSLNRGWCIEYADEFHLDITPSIENHQEPYNHSELVADKKLKEWKPTNPKEYVEWFNNSAEKLPSMPLTRAIFESVAMDHAKISDFPDKNPRKLLLKRFVQLFKRHRDVIFEGKDNKPISIIITTLATKSYLYCIENFNYDSEYDLMVDTLKFMPDFIEQKYGEYWVDNPTVDGENFAEKWNKKPIRKEAFYQWHRKCEQFFSNFNEDMGQHVLFESLEKGFGSKPTELIREQYIKTVDNSRQMGSILGSSAGVVTSVKANTFYGV